MINTMDNLQNVTFNKLLSMTGSRKRFDNFLIIDHFNYEGPGPRVSSIINSYIRMSFSITLFIVNGYIRVRIGTKEYLVTNNSWLVLFQGKIVQILETSPDLELRVLAMQSDFLDITFDAGKTLELQDVLERNPTLEVDSEVMQEFLTVIDYMKKYQSDVGNIFRVEIVKNYFRTLFLNFYHLLNTKIAASKAPTRKEEIHQSFIREVEKHYNHEKTVKFYADKLCLTPKYLSTVIYNLTGRHASQWIEEYIILESKALLKASYLSIQQIAYGLNFDTSSHFSRFFKRVTGVSPKQYRES